MEGYVYGGGMNSTQDRVIEQGMKDGWDYRIWASGKKECWRKEAYSETGLTSNMATGVYSNTNFRWRDSKFPPGLFSEQVEGFVSVESTGYTLCQVCECTINTLQYRVWASYPQSVALKINLYAIGA